MSNALLVTAVHVKMKLGDNALNNERLSLVMTRLPIKKYRIVAVILLPYNVSTILKLKGHIKGRLISRILNFLKNLSSGLKIFANLIKKTKMFTKTLTRALRYILIKPSFLAIVWSYLNYLSHTFLKRLKLL